MFATLSLRILMWISSAVQFVNGQQKPVPCTLSKTQAKSGTCMCNGKIVTSCTGFKQSTFATFYMVDIYDLEATVFDTNFKIEPQNEPYFLRITSCKYLNPAGISKLLGPNLVGISIYDTFQSAPQGSILDLSNSSNKITQTFELRSLGSVQVKMPDVLSYEENLISPQFWLKIVVSEVKIADKQANILVQQDSWNNRMTIQWGVANIYPAVYSRQNAQIYQFFVEKGPSFMVKETFLYAGRIAKFLDYGNVIQRIEYGTIHNGKEVKFSNWFIDPYEQQLLFQGKCNHLQIIPYCVICYMHQYGLHLTKDDLHTKCYTHLPLKIEMKRCYWREPQPVPKKLENKAVTSYWVEPGIKVCDQIPDDVNKFLETIPTASDSETDIGNYGQSDDTTSGAIGLNKQPCLLQLVMMFVLLAK